MTNDLIQLAHANRHGFAFLVAYGATWLAASVMWKLRGPRWGAYAVLFQGMIALPLALVLQAATRAGPAPDDELLSHLVVFMATSQLFALPLVIYFLLGREYQTAVIVLGTAVTVHLAPYAWLYQTPLYLILSAVLAVGIFVTARLADRAGGPGQEGSWTIPTFIGAVLVSGAAAALALQ